MDKKEAEAELTILKNRMKELQSQLNNADTDSEESDGTDTIVFRRTDDAMPCSSKSVSNTNAPSNRSQSVSNNHVASNADTNARRNDDLDFSRHSDPGFGFNQRRDPDHRTYGGFNGNNRRFNHGRNNHQNSFSNDRGQRNYNNNRGNYHDNRGNYNNNAMHQQKFNSLAPPRQATFSGRESWEAFINAFEARAIIKNYDEDVMLEMLQSCLTGDALDFVFTVLEPYQANTYNSLRNALNKRFQDYKTPEDYLRILRSTKLKDTACISEYTYDIKKLTSKAYPGLNGLNRDRLEVRHFLEGIYDYKLRYEVSAK